MFAKEKIDTLATACIVAGMFVLMSTESNQQKERTFPHIPISAHDEVASTPVSIVADDWCIGHAENARRLASGKHLMS
jgi:hypothetical protein